jgi:hypothetical protein
MVYESRPIEKKSAAIAMAESTKNDLRKYPAPDKDGDRLYPLARPEGKPSFEMGSDDTIFAIGSCFARSIERTMIKDGRTVLSRDFDLGEIGEGITYSSNFFNKYSIHSINNELKWALERDTFPGADLLFQIGQDEYADFQLGHPRLNHPLEDILTFRTAYLDGMARVADADVVIVTLGYVETWYDNELGIYLNGAPTFRLAATNPNRFEFRVLSYSDVLDGLNELYTLLTKHRKKPMKMLITVSPVPLLSTFRNMDVLIANQYSKSVQRAAIEEFIMDKEGVDYFPSYEFVTLSNPAAAWTPHDYRHVSNAMVKNIMMDVQEKYTDQKPKGKRKTVVTTESLLSSVEMLRNIGDPAAALELIQKNRGLADGSSGVLTEEMAVNETIRDYEGVYNAATKVLAETPEYLVGLEQMIRACRYLDKMDEAENWATVHATAHPDRSATLKRLMKLKA